MLDNSAKTLGLTFPITLLDRADEVIERLVAFWHKGDIPTALTNVRFQGNSGPGVVGLRQSVSDPIQTAASPHWRLTPQRSSIATLRGDHPSFSS